MGILLLNTEVAEEEHSNLIARAANAMVVSGPFGVFLCSADQAQLCWPDASPPNPCTLVGHGGTGVLPAVCLQHS